RKSRKGLTAFYPGNCAEQQRSRTAKENYVKTNILAIGAALVALSLPAVGQDGTQIIWGGGKAGASVYTDVYVPHLVNILEQNRLAGYAWGGPSDGTVANALKVTQNPTNLAV